MALDDMIAQNRRPRPFTRRGRPASSKPYDRAPSHRQPHQSRRPDLDQDWKHDRFAGPPTKQIVDSPSSSLKVENLHWNVTEDDLFKLFSSVGVVESARINYDNAGRSEGTAVIHFSGPNDAQAALSTFQGVELDEMKMNLSVLPPKTPRNLGAPRNDRQNRGGRNEILSRLGPESVFKRLGNKQGDFSSRLGPPMKSSGFAGGYAGNGFGGRGGGRGGFGRGRGRSNGLSKTKEDLDAEMDSYMSVDSSSVPAETEVNESRTVVSYADDSGPPQGE
ncbi:hypothetical protein HK098_007308 [Nowakowskiella sp. JEL0407]|nr:hypothetical protein HK098_007308 [Nowakowskiella sp. JEL0407]